ncbi:hypothetical protein [Flavilitoribacter nigricans]|uniref:Uncharacterized protein n=1 Tax=Flavilitoribacter nigricans (strain ATCC 23147 / DSM 23189 / NBRC 102662 / NCIMB 1420 / SS-2) TaxID=1122177 RepID=A0A2D0N3C5_FLAN2|nr:hypothetical protein [Flavilitoribacter nigricans]PHN02947.1 hypothetical protein CRP01_29520 [Flavilitoribacter nigricans DSM 23189 = NBRC 102662]
MSGSRSDQLAEIAYRIKVDFSPEDDWGLINLLEDFKLFRRGFRKTISNVFRSRDDFLETDLRVFDYQYTISTGKTSKRFRQTVFFADSRKLGLPEFRMKPELFIHKIGALLGFEDINFEEFPEFSRQYYLKSSDEQYLRASMHDGILRFFSVEKGWRVEGVNYYLIFYKKDVLFPPQEIKAFYEKGTQVFELFRDKD